jgi:Uma2 family endonuclease
MMRGVTLTDYFRWPEDTRHRELVFGMVREPPSPFAPHQRIQVRVTVLLDTHVRAQRLGTVLAAPMDVVLDRQRALVVQPDVMFISTARSGIIQDRIWGAPDLVVEIASPSSRHYDCGEKLEWYRTYGVRECWLVDPEEASVTVVDCGSGGEASTRVAVNEEAIASIVLSRFHHSPAELFC